MSKSKVLPPFNPSDDAYRHYWTVLEGLAVNDAAAAEHHDRLRRSATELAEHARDIVLAGQEVAEQTWEGNGE